jgi:hypothetical protein
MSETNAHQGQLVVIANAATNTVNIVESAGVTDLNGTGNYAAGQYDTISLIYMSDRWVETARSNN